MTRVQVPDETQLLFLIAKMHEKFDMAYDGPPRHLSKEEREFRTVAMKEELAEYESAKTLEEQYDALLDLLVFTVGTLYRQGLPVLRGYEAVMRCNMDKRVGSHAKRNHFKQDLVKPEGWIGPERALRGILVDKELEHAKR